MNRLATTEMVVKNHFCHPPASAKKLNAAPSLWYRTKSKNEVMNNLSPNSNACCTRCLVYKSTTTTIALMLSHFVKLPVNIRALKHIDVMLPYQTNYHYSAHIMLDAPHWHQHPNDNASNAHIFHAYLAILLFVAPLRLQLYTLSHLK